MVPHQLRQTLPLYVREDKDKERERETEKKQRLASRQLPHSVLLLPRRKGRLEAREERTSPAVLTDSRIGMRCSKPREDLGPVWPRKVSTSL